MKVQAVILAVLVAMGLAATPMVFGEAEASVALGYRSPATTAPATSAAPTIDIAATTVVAPAVVISLPVETSAPLTEAPEATEAVDTTVVEAEATDVAAEPMADVPVPAEAPPVAPAPAIEIAELPVAPAEAELVPAAEPAQVATIDPALFAPAPISGLAGGTTGAASSPVAVQASTGSMFPEGLDVDPSSDMVELLVSGSGAMFPAELGNDIDFDADMVALTIDDEIAG